jgi:hypothetical protein
LRPARESISSWSGLLRPSYKDVIFVSSVPKKIVSHEGPFG